MTEFAASVHKRIAALQASHAKADLQRRAVSLQTLIAGKAPAATVAATARALAADLIKAHPVPLAPVKTPVFDRGQALFTQNCASCHGLNGDEKGPALVSLQPPTAAFADKDRARERSVFAFYPVLEQGIEGTTRLLCLRTDQRRWQKKLRTRLRASFASVGLRRLNFQEHSSRIFNGLLDAAKE